MKENKQKKPITIEYESRKLSVVYFIPLLLIAGVVPLITYAKFVNLEGTAQALYWTGQTEYLDFFSYWKSQWVMALTAIATVIYAILYKQKKLPFKDLKIYYIPMAIYAVCVIVSTLFAIDVDTALWGFVDMYQGMFVLLSYVMITFLTINFVNNERDVSLFAKAFLFLMIVEGILGVTQYFGFDFFQTELGQKLILPSNIQVDGGLEFSFGPKTIYGTLFNTNFVGSFATLMLPLSVALLIGSKTRKQRIVSGLAVILMIFTWIGCNSRAGYVGMAVSGLFAIVLVRRVIFKHWKISAGLVAVILVLAVGLNVVSGGMLVYKLKSLNLSKAIEDIKTVNKSGTKIEDVTVGKNTFSVRTNLETLNFRIENDRIYFLDQDNQELPIEIKGENITITDSRYSGYRITNSSSYPIVTVTRQTYYSWTTVSFWIGQDKVQILGSGGRLADPVVAKSVKSLDEFGRFASSRGYIWNRTIPLFSETFIKGSGADNYPFVFPQDDFVAKLNIGMDANTVVDKPHNMYLQMCINTGVVSLVSLLIMWIAYVVSSLKLYWRSSFDSVEKLLGIACVISTIGYLSAAIFNDHIVSVSPLFWIVLGIGISINIRLRNQLLKQC